MKAYDILDASGEVLMPFNAELHHIARGENVAKEAPVTCLGFVRNQPIECCFFFPNMANENFGLGNIVAWFGKNILFIKSTILPAIGLMMSATQPTTHFCVVFF